MTQKQHFKFGELSFYEIFCFLNLFFYLEIKIIGSDCKTIAITFITLSNQITTISDERIVIMNRN